MLGGGGSRGAFQAGAVATLVGDLGLRPDVIAGTSAGSLNALVLAHARTPAEFPETVELMLAAWTSLRGTSDMYEPRTWLAHLTPERRRAAMEMAGGRITPGAILELTRSTAAVRRFAGDFRADGDSAYGLAPVERRLRAEVDPARVAASHARLRVSAVSMESGRLRWVDGAGVMYDDDAVTPLAGGPVDVVDAVLASSAFAPAFPPRRLAGDRYVDGGFRTVLPVRAARALGAGPIVAVACASEGIEWSRPADPTNVLQVTLRAVNATLAEVARRDVEDLRRGPGLLIDPTADVHDFLEVDPGRLSIEIDLGRMVAAERVEAAGGLDRILLAWEPGAPGVSDAGAEALARTAALTRAVTLLRLDAWRHEERLLAGRPKNGAAEALRATRIRKWLLRHAVAARAARPGLMPAGADAWVSEFEHHAERPVVRGPWAALSERNGGPVPAADAESFTPEPFEVFVTETGERWQVVEGRRRAPTAGAPAVGPGVQVDRVVAELVPED